MWLGLLGIHERQVVKIPDDKLTSVLDFFINGEMSKAQAMQAINRMAANACEAAKSDDRSQSLIKYALPDNDYDRWTDADGQRLMSLRAQGYAYDIIARELRRTTRSVRTKFLEIQNQEKATAQQKVEQHG